MEKFIEQIKTYCNCIGKYDDKDIKEALNIIASATCWHSDGVPSFAKMEREEIIEVDLSCCRYEFVPYYKPFDKTSFEFKLVRVPKNPTEPMKVTNNLTFEYFNGVFYVDTPLDCKCECECTCGDDCGEEVRLVATYIAGYEEFPDWILPIMCDIVQLVHAKRECKCDDTCACGYTKNQEEVVTYAKGDVITHELQNNELAKILVNEYKDLLGAISLCGDVKEEIWGSVV